MLAKASNRLDINILEPRTNGGLAIRRRGDGRSLMSALCHKQALRPAPQPAGAPTYGVEISPLLVATIRRLPHRKIEMTLPTPGTVSPRVTRNVPLGPSNTAVPFITSRSVQPSMVVGLVSGTGANFTGA
jgi:hypothetical protein